MHWLEIQAHYYLRSLQQRSMLWLNKERVGTEEVPWFQKSPFNSTWNE